MARKVDVDDIATLMTLSAAFGIPYKRLSIWHYRDRRLPVLRGDLKPPLFLKSEIRQWLSSEGNA